MQLDIPVEVISELNWRGHYMARHRRLKGHKGMAYACCLRSLGFPKKWPGRYAITLTRIKGPRQRDFDSDNLASSMKGVRDGIAQYLGIDDGSERLVWAYRQEKGSQAAVRMEIEEI